MHNGWTPSHQNAAALSGRRCVNCGLVQRTVRATWAWHATAPPITWPLCDDCKAEHEALDAWAGDCQQRYEPIPPLTPPSHMPTDGQPGTAQ